MELLFTVEQGLYDVKVEMLVTIQTGYCIPGVNYSEDSYTKQYETLKTIRAVSAAEVAALRSRYSATCYRLTVWGVTP